ncbi:MAG: DnaT-like ssDNA-binding domain-containing protein [Succinivibrionaceae bacterium]
MNTNELQILLKSSISHQAKLIYSIILTSSEFEGKVKLNYLNFRQVLLLTRINELRFTETVYDPNMQEINNFVNELIFHGLIKIVTEPKIPNYFDECTCIMLLRNSQNNLDFNQQLVKLTPNWRPSPSFNEQARLAGLIDSKFTIMDINDFISYWIGKNEFATPYRWNDRFIKHLKYAKSIH